MNRALFTSAFVFLAAPCSASSVSIASDDPCFNVRDFDNHQGLDVVMLGTGVPGSVRGEGGSGVLVVVDGDAILVDVGPGVVKNMSMAGVSVRDVSKLLITHTHYDHIADLPEFVAGLRNDTLEAFGAGGVRDVVSGAKTMLGFHLEQLGAHDLDPEITVRELPGDGQFFESSKVSLTAFRTVHFYGDDVSLGYRIDTPYGSVAVSGDTAPSSSVVQAVKGVDVLVHEGWHLEPAMAPGHYGPQFESSEFNDVPRLEDGLAPGGFSFGGHTSPVELGKVAERAGVKTLLIYHYPPFAETAVEKYISERVFGISPQFSSWANKERYMASVSAEFSGEAYMAEPFVRVSQSEEGASVYKSACR